MVAQEGAGAEDEQGEKQAADGELDGPAAQRGHLHSGVLWATVRQKAGGVHEARADEEGVEADEYDGDSPEGDLDGEDPAPAGVVEVAAGDGLRLVEAVADHHAAGEDDDDHGEPGDAVEAAEVSRRRAQFLYGEGDKLNFMLQDDFDQFSLNKKIVGAPAKFLQDGMEVEVLLYGDKPINIQLPVKVLRNFIQKIFLGNESQSKILPVLMVMKCLIKLTRRYAVVLFIQPNGILQIEMYKNGANVKK